VKNQLGLLLKNVGLKKPMLKIFFFVFNTQARIKHTYRSKVAPMRIRKRSQNGVLAIDICTEHGFGAKIEWCIEILAYCDEHQLQPAIKFTYPAGNKDFFTPYFSIKQIKEKQPLQFTSIKLMSELGFAKDYGSLLTIDRAHQLINKYLIINDWVQQEVNAFYQDNFKGRKVIGIHYRGTDKVGEAPEIPYEKVINNIKHVQSAYFQDACVFLSTDDNNFIAYFKTNLPDVQLIMRNDYQRSDDDKPVHLNVELDKFEVNRDALVNCLLLSKCDFLIKSSSFLSDISKLFNPKVPVVMLNKPYARALWFPASEIIKDMAFAPLN
jgi:hypothetical protein